MTLDMPPYRELLLGAGSRQHKRMSVNGMEQWANLTTVDYEPSHNPDVVWDLTETPWPFDDNTFDEVHGYELWEHLGRQGDFKSFFAQFYEAWRILKPNGLLAGSCPTYDSPWLWGDPGHTRYIGPESFTYLSQEMYAQQVGVTAMSDYRQWWKGDFDTAVLQRQEETLFWGLQAIKPARHIKSEVSWDDVDGDVRPFLVQRGH